VIRLLEKEPTAAERYAHAAELLAILERHAVSVSEQRTRELNEALHEPAIQESSSRFVDIL
jgi:hypothetical protein